MKCPNLSVDSNCGVIMSRQKGAVLPESTLALALLTVVIAIAAIGLISIFKNRESKSFETMQQVGPCSQCEEGRPCLKNDPEICPQR